MSSIFSALLCLHMISILRARLIVRSLGIKYCSPASFQLTSRAYVHDVPHPLPVKQESQCAILVCLRISCVCAHSYCCVLDHGHNIYLMLFDLPWFAVLLTGSPLHDSCRPTFLLLVPAVSVIPHRPLQSILVDGVAIMAAMRPMTDLICAMLPTYSSPSLYA